MGTLNSFRQNEFIISDIDITLSETLIKSLEDDVASILSLPDVPANAVACKSKDDAC